MKKYFLLVANYYGKVKPISDGIVANQFYQIENHILATVHIKIL